MPRVLLVRHGESTWNAEGRWQGQADPELSELGMRQAVTAARSSQLRDVRGLWASDLQRARASADLVAGELAVAVTTEPLLRERDAGAWTGLTTAEIHDAYPGFLGSGRRPAGWEDDATVLDRALAAIVSIAAHLDGGDALAVSHGGVIRVVERHLGADPQPIPNLSGRWLAVSDGAVMLGERVELLDPDDVEVTIPGQI